MYVDNQIRIYESVVLLVLYILYVVVVFVGRMVRVRVQKRRRQRKELWEASKQITMETTELPVTETATPVTEMPANVEEILVTETTIAPVEETKAPAEDDMSPVTEPVAPLTPKTTPKHVKIITETSDTSFDAAQNEKDDAEDWTMGFQHRRANTFSPLEKSLRKPAQNVRHSLHARTRNLTLSFEQEFHFDEDGEVVMKPEPEVGSKQNYFYMIVQYFAEWIGWYKMRWYQRIFFVCFDWFTILIRNLTIPKANLEEWSRVFTCMVPIFAPLVILFTVNVQCKLIKNVSL
jgi:Na+-transporting methylmalonyl-CoA/oxaloacetate decarboxylase gamma subunit